MAHEATRHDAQLRTALLYPNVAQLARRGRYREAEAWAAQLLDAASDADLWCLRGKIHAQQGRFEDADKALRHALAVDNGHVGAAAALACVARLSARTARSGLLSWQWPAVALAALLVVAFVLPFGAPQGERGTDDALRLIAPVGGDRALVNAATPASRTVPDPLLLDEYAAVVAALRTLPAAQGLSLNAVTHGDHLAIRVGGTVPTHHIARLVQASASARVGVDVSALRVDGYYRVKPGDTLSGLARTLYGDEDAWREIWEANRASVANPHLLRPGAILLFP